MEFVQEAIGEESSTVIDTAKIEEEMKIVFQAADSYNFFKTQKKQDIRTRHAKLVEVDKYFIFAREEAMKISIFSFSCTFLSCISASFRVQLTAADT